MDRQWYEEVERAAPDKTKSMPIWPNDVYRMQALVEAYFPAMAKTATPVLQACIHYRKAVLNARTAAFEGKANIWGEDFGQAYNQLVNAAEALRTQILKQMHAD